MPPNPYTELSSGVDIVYSSKFPRGGSIGCHSDDEMNWGMVIVLSLGQTRYFRVRRKSDGDWVNVKLGHNSLTVMYGPTFQELYTHQVDKLKEGEPVGIRMSMNARFLLPKS
jgi:alkylated DNA repair dioxygenase AlkB